MTTVAESTSYNRSCMAWKAKNIYFLSFYRKYLPTPDLNINQDNGDIGGEQSI